MKSTLLFTLPLFLTMALCSKDDTSFKSNGVITGRDYRKCACRGERCGCCGDWVVQIDSTTYIFKELPKGTKLNLWELEQSNGFPIKVSLDWGVDPASCAESWGYIVVDRIRLD